VAVYILHSKVVIPHQEGGCKFVKALFRRLVIGDHASFLRLAGGEEDTNGRGVPVLFLS
jgi:hypothetical protein